MAGVYVPAERARPASGRGPTAPAARCCRGRSRSSFSPRAVWVRRKRPPRGGPGGGGKRTGRRALRGRYPRATVPRQRSRQRIAESEARHLHERPIVGPELGGAAVQGAQGDLQVEDPRAAHAEVSGGADQAGREAGSGPEHGHPARLERTEKRRRLVGRRWPAARGGMGDDREEFGDARESDGESTGGVGGELDGWNVPSGARRYRSDGRRRADWCRARSSSAGETLVHRRAVRGIDARREPPLDRDPRQPDRSRPAAPRRATSKLGPKAPLDERPERLAQLGGPLFGRREELIGNLDGRLHT